MQCESTGQPDLARDSPMIQRQSGVLASKATDETDIIFPDNALFCTWGGHVLLTPWGPFPANQQHHYDLIQITVFMGFHFSTF